MALLAPALRRLRDENINIRWPNRDRSTDGWIGDSSHQASGSPENGGSDHNPNVRGYVDAIDVDKDGIHVPTVIAAAIRSSAVHYVIWNRRIFSAKDGFAPRAYTGRSPHTDHIHISIQQLRTAELWTGTWRLILKGMSAVTLKKGSKGDNVKDLQALLNGWGYSLRVDGDFGDGTLAAVKSFQASHGLLADGIVGSKTKAKLRP